MDSHEERDRRLRQLASDQKRGKETARKGRWRLQNDQCAYCKEIGHWTQECPKKAGGKGSKTDQMKILELDELSDSGSRGSDPLPETRVTLRVEGTPVDFLVDTGAQHSVLCTPQGKLANKKS